MTKQEIAIKGAAAQAKIDKYLTLAYKASLENARITELGIKAEMVTKVIEAKTIAAEAREIPGMIAAAAKAAALLHAKQTGICVKNDCDLPTPASAGGITVLGGGGR
jgi:hypothetical protein